MVGVAPKGDFAFWSGDDSAEDSVVGEFVDVCGGNRFVTVVYSRGTRAGIKILRGDHDIHGG